MGFSESHDGVACALLRPVGSSHVDRPIVALARDLYAPGVAAHFAVLNEAARHVGLDVNLALLAAIRAGHGKLVETHQVIMRLGGLGIHGTRWHS